jgi:hypothetical protein
MSNENIEALCWALRFVGFSVLGAGFAITVMLTNVAVSLYRLANLLEDEDGSNDSE